MKKFVIGFSTAALVIGSAGVLASEHGMEGHGSTAAAHHSTGHAAEHSSPYYVILKGLMTTGDIASHGHGVTLDGNNGAGIGLDFGYKINHNLAIEFVTSYARNSVTETVSASARTLRNTAATTHDTATTTTTTATHDTTSTTSDVVHAAAGHSVTADASYLTYGLSLAYTMHVTEKSGLLFKVGYEGEREKIGALNISSTNYGLTYAAGVEVKLDNHYELVFEYEGSKIKGPRGSSVFAGIKYNY